jgi:hypothetical protein
METVSEVVYWAVLLYTPIYWFIGLIVLGGCFIAGTIWSTLACSFRPQTPAMSRRSLDWHPERQPATNGIWSLSFLLALDPAGHQDVWGDFRPATGMPHSTSISGGGPAKRYHLSPLSARAGHPERHAGANSFRSLAMQKR